MVVIQEIYYETSGQYKERKELYLVYRFGVNGDRQDFAVLPRSKANVLPNALRLVPLKVSFDTFKKYEKEM